MNTPHEVLIDMQGCIDCAKKGRYNDSVVRRSGYCIDHYVLRNREDDILNMGIERMLHEQNGRVPFNQSGDAHYDVQWISKSVEYLGPVKTDEKIPNIKNKKDIWKYNACNFM